MRRASLTLALLAGACATAIAIAAGTPSARRNGHTPVPRVPTSVTKPEVARRIARKSPIRKRKHLPATPSAPPKDSSTSSPRRDVALTVTVVPRTMPVVTEFALEQNAPNPMRDETQIRFRSPVLSKVRVEILSIEGRRVAVPVDGQFPPGVYSIPWRAVGEDGRRLMPGLYLMRMTVGSPTRAVYDATRKVTIIG